MYVLNIKHVGGGGGGVTRRRRILFLDWGPPFLENYHITREESSCLQILWEPEAYG